MYSVLNPQYLLFSHGLLLFPHWEHEEGPHNEVFSVSTRLDKGKYVHKHTPITPSAQNQRFYSIKASYRSHSTRHGTSQSSFNTQQNVSLPKGPCHLLNHSFISVTSPHKAMHYNDPFTLQRRDTDACVYSNHNTHNVCITFPTQSAV